MNILVTAPTAMELEPFITKNNNKTEVLITGVGGAFTMYQLMKHFEHNSYDLVIQAGICGSYDVQKFALGDVVIVDKDIFGDVGIIENGEYSSMAEIGFSHEEDKVFGDGWMINDHPLLPILSLPKASNLSMNTITDNKEHEDIFYNKYKPDVEAMEGAAFHYVCLKNNQPFLQLRAVSNAVGERDKSMWQIMGAIQNLTTAIYDTIDELIKNKAYATGN